MEGWAAAVVPETTARRSIREYERRRLISAVYRWGRATIFARI